jgi:hypothetical protein
LRGLKRNLLLLLALAAVTLFAFCLSVQVKAQTDNIIWKDEMNYQSFDQMQTAGWTSEHPDGVSFGSQGVILDQTNGDTAVHYIGHFSSGIYDWQVEDQSRWISGDHSGNDISALTEKHSYSFSADGWYSNFVFYHDGSKVYTSEKGTYSESKNTLFILSMVKIGTQINCYYNGQLEYTYTESDSTPSQLNGVDAVSPWQGSSEYNYFQLSSASVFPSSVSPQSDNILSNPLVVGGVVGGVGIGVGLAVYFGFIAGGHAGASAGSGSVITNNPTSPSNGGTQSNPSSDAGSGNLGIGPISDQISNITDINNFWSDFIQDPTGNIISTEPVNPSYSNSPQTMIGNGPSTPTPQTSENPAPQHQNLTDILQLIDQGEHIATDAFNQGTMNQDSYQHYLEQTTNIMQTINQSITQQSQLGHDAIDGANSR